MPEFLYVGAAFAVVTYTGCCLIDVYARQPIAWRHNLIFPLWGTAGYISGIWLILTIASVRL